MIKAKLGIGVGIMWREALGLSKISAGFIAVLVGYSSSAVIILQAADAVGATSDSPVLACLSTIKIRCLRHGRPPGRR